MTDNTRIPSLAELRDDLLQKFTAETFRHLFLYTSNPDLRPIRHEFAPADGLNALVAKVLQYCETRSLLDALRQEADQYNPSQYALAVPIIPTPFNLPAGLADFTGRRADITKVRRSLEQGGATVISGMGGIGKTALALHVAHQLAAEGRFGDAQLYLDLKGTGPVPDSTGLTTGVDPAAALQALLSALLGRDPQRPGDVETLADLWRRAIHGRDAVLILDNAANAAQVRPLLAGCASCAVLVTSRQRFALPGAVRLDLDPMDPADARVLLQCLAPGLGDEGVDAIAKLCGWLPLALRVAGNYLALNDDVSPEQYASRLAGERDRLSRLRDPEDPGLNVEATITPSVTQLGDEARRAWALLALFPAPFDLAAAAVLWDEPDENAVLERLQALRNRSLVSYDAGASRYGQHDLLRLAAGRDLADAVEDEIPAARDRVARHYLAVARDVRATQRYLDLDPDWPHLRAALEHAANTEVGLLSDLVYALFEYWSARGLAREWATWSQRAVGACAEASRRRDEGGHLGILGLAYADLGDVRKAIEYHEAALAIAQQISDRRNEGNQLGNLGTAYYRLGEVRKAIEYFETTLAIAQELGDPRNEDAWLGSLGVAYARLGDTRRAIEYHEAALAIAQKIGDRRGEGADLSNLGVAYAHLGQMHKAIEQYEAALTIAREIGDRRGEADALANLGVAYRDLGEPVRAREYWTQALPVYQAIEDPRADKYRRLLAELED